MFSVKIDNRSNKTIKSVSAGFIQRTTFIAKISRQNHNYKLLKAIYAGPTIGPGTLADWPNVQFQIPIVCPSLLDTCKIIKIEYMLALDVDVSIISLSDDRLEIPLIIGTIPLVDSNESSSTAPSNVAYCSVPDPTVINENTPGVNNAVPNVETEATFTPKYPYYKDLLPS